MCSETMSKTFDYLCGRKKLHELSTEELEEIPLEILIKFARPYDLLLVWPKLPLHYQSYYDLQICLPCFIHYNIGEEQGDGSAQSQATCYYCNSLIYKNYL